MAGKESWGLLPATNLPLLLEVWQDMHQLSLNSQ
jgi:hypothetical protein